jgi:hypothetical protein
MLTSMGVFLIAAGVVLRFGVAAGSRPGLTVRVVGVILILAGVLGLLLPLLVRGGLLKPRRLTRSARPGGYDDSGPEETNRATAAGVARVGQDAPKAEPGQAKVNIRQAGEEQGFLQALTSPARGRTGRGLSRPLGLSGDTTRDGGRR